jgi:hypothetical protein
MDPLYWETALRNRNIGFDWLNPTNDMMILSLLDRIRELEARLERLEHSHETRTRGY